MPCVYMLDALDYGLYTMVASKNSRASALLLYSNTIVYSSSLTTNTQNIMLKGRIMKKAIVYLLFSIIFTINSPATAVDGYKNITFGMSKQQVQNSALCDFIEINVDPIVGGLTCNNLIFASETIEAVGYFIDDKLLRFVIAPPYEKAISINKSLSNKYGAPSNISSRQQLNAVDYMTNQDAYIFYDNNTVVVNFMSDENSNKTLLIMYTSPEYEIQLLNKQQESMSGDL